MVRPVTSKYQIWLAGYYDDFLGARALPDDSNTPNVANTYDDKNSHHGNMLNGEATLNPRFRWSVTDRNRLGSTHVSTTTNKYLKNKGSFEFASNDTIRQQHYRYQGKSQLQYPDGHTNANRSKYNEGTDSGLSGTDINGYQLFCNGYNTLGRYLVSTGTIDATYGRENMEAYYTTDGSDFTNTNYALKKAGAFNSGGSLDGGGKVRETSFANITGVWQGETLTFTETTTPLNLFHPVKSPSGKPFLVIHTNANNNNPIISYDGSLNSKLDGDVFTARVCFRSFIGTTSGAGSPPKITFKIGYAATTLTNSKGFTGTPAITYEWYNAKYSSGRAYTYDYFGGAYVGNDTDQNIVNDDCWLDFDFVMDYSNSEYDVYCDGELLHSGLSMSGTPTAASMYGWQIESSTNENHSTLFCMIDRVGLVRPLSDHMKHADRVAEAPISNLQLSLVNNGFSRCGFTLYDDAEDTDVDNTYGEDDSDYAHNKLKNLFSASTPSNWEVLLFGDESNRIDRPIWRGVITDFTISEGVRAGREIKISANDRTALLDTQLPVWDIGQESIPTEYGTEVPYWLTETEGYKEMMYLGTKQLKLLDKSIGFNSGNSYLEESNQRMQLYSGLPIQMYNNEDTEFGPNNLHHYYEGIDILGFGKGLDGSWASGTSGTLRSYIEIGAQHATTAYSIDSTALKIANSNISAYNTTTSNITLKTKFDSPAAVSSSYLSHHNGNQLLFFDGLTYTPETAKIVMINNYSGAVYSGATNMFSFPQYDTFQDSHPTANDPTTDTYNFYMDADPSLNIGDYIYVNSQDDNTSTIQTGNILNSLVRGRHKVVNVKRIYNYFVNSNAVNWFTNFLWVVTTDRPYAFFDKGNYVNSTLLSGNNRYSWQKDTGATLTPASSNHTLVQYRNLHTKWMADLPKSLWFQYRYGQINRLAKAQGRVQSSILANSTSVQIDVTLYNTLNVAGKRSGVAEITTSGTSPQAYKYVKFIYKGVANVGSNYYLIGCQFLNVPITASSSGLADIATLKICDISDDYKHLWLLWADMRNNGQANADGESRKTDFGLASPIFQNYKPTLYFTDQFKSNGQVDKFTELKIGEDILIENVNPVSDISTTGPMSKPVDYDNVHTSTLLFADSSGALQVTTQAVHGLSTGDYVHIYNSNLHDGHYQITVTDPTVFTCGAGTSKGTESNGDGTFGKIGGLRFAPITGSESDTLTKYHDWEDKAGAFLVIDTSPFFNLNTFINGGKVGQVAGGNTNLVDYDTQTRGFVSLIDNYYNEATPTYKNVDGGLKQHENQFRIISDATLIDSTVFSVDNGISVGDAGIMVDDLTIFDDSGIGRIMARQKDDGSTVNTDKDYYFTWSMKQETEYTAGVNQKVSAGGTGSMTGATIPADHTEISTDSINGAKTFLEWGAKAGMMIFRTTILGDTTKHKIVQVTEWDDSGTTRQDRLLVTGTWANADTWKIPKQLGGIKTVDATIENTFESATSSSSGLEQSIMTYIDTNNITVGSTVAILLKDDTTNTEDRFDNITVNSTVSNQFALRMLMHLEGRVESKSSGTYYDSDKFRSLWLSSLLYNWRAPVKLPLMYDINNIPLTNNMTSDGSTSNIDNYGSTLNANSQNLLNITKDISKSSGFGTTNNHHTSFSWLAGRDGRLSYRPKYNSGVSFDRLNVQKNSFKSEVSGQISNVRVFYDQSKSFIDYPATNLTDSTSWKVIQMPQITQSLEALKIAQKEYNKNKTSKLVLNVTPRQDSYLEDTLTVNVADKMLHTGRYGYIADPYIAFHGNGEIGSSNSYQYWTRLGSGGALFTGTQNALDGNMKTSTDIYHRYGDSKYSQTSSHNGSVNWSNNFYWYGAKSIAYAVQVVDVANRCPLVSETTGEDMRMFVAIKPNQAGVSIDDLVFTVYMVDYAYSDAREKVTQDITTNNYGSVDVKGNGFYEIPIPKTYWSNDGSISGAKIVISVNTDYCRALLRHRCGDPTHANIVRNSNSIHDINLSADGSGSDYNDNSIFPLGGKIFGEFHMFDAPRQEYYAPRVHICKDMKYRPATYVTYTDKSLDLSNEILTIEKINWRVSMADEEVSLTLINDESLNTSTVEQFLFSSANNPVFQPNPPPVLSLPTTENTTSTSTVSNSNNVGGQGQSTTVPSSETSGSTGLSFTQDNNINTMSSTTYGNITNRIGLGDDNNSFSEFSILGQTRPNAVPSSNRGIDASVDLKPTGGTATITDDGISFPGIGFTEDSNTPVNVTTAKLKVKIPRDIKTNDISINSYITHAVNQPSSNIAELTVTVTCDQNGNSKSQTTLINANLNNSYNSLFSNKVVGAEVAGNTLTIEIKRVAGSTNDSSDYNSVVLSDTEVTLNRASGHSRATTNTFTTYS
tara:strand:- start:4832 stop:11926 length:7095 start_codon:yes stop_codon:yes gene_type:complete